MKFFFIRLAGWCGAIFVFLTRLTLRFKYYNDPRGPMRGNERYVYATLHSHLLNFCLVSDDTPIAAMVSPATAGEVLIPICKIRDIIPCRGASMRKGHEHRKKGGRRALQIMGEHVENLRPAFLAVDGPHGPRNHVHWGIADIAIEKNAKIVIAGIFPSMRIPFPWTWDRTQIPLPFSTLHCRFAPVVDPADFESRVELRQHIEDVLTALEQEHDPSEFRFKGQSRHKSPKKKSESPASADNKSETSEQDKAAN